MIVIKEKEYTAEDVRTALNRAMRLLRVKEYDVKIELREGVGYVGCYDIEQKLIRMNIDSLLTERENYEMSMDSFVTSILAHEMGHHIHLQTPDGIRLDIARKRTTFKPFKFTRRVLIEAEKKAWEYGSLVIPSEMQTEFDYMNKMNLTNCSYWKNLDDREKSFKRLKEKYGIGQ